MTITVPLPSPGPVIWINGFRSVGKSTITGHLRRLMGESNTTFLHRTGLGKHVKGDERNEAWAEQYGRLVANFLTQLVFAPENFSRTIVITGMLQPSLLFPQVTTNTDYE